MIKLIKSSLTIITIVVTVLTGCKKEVAPVIMTKDVSDVRATTAFCGGDITSEGSSTITARGVCWSTGTTPTIADSKTSDGTGAGSFTSNLTGLNGATVYYVRAYATNSAGVGYGMAMSFTTLGQSPSPYGVAATNIDSTTATLNGLVNANFLSTVVTFEYGTTTSYGSTATSSQSPVTGYAPTSVNKDITELTPGSIYHFRVKAVNSLGTSYGNDLTFTTLGLVPTVSILAATFMTNDVVALNGNVNANYLSTIVTFEYGTTISYGLTERATQSPVTGNTATNVSAAITDLMAGTVYHFRVKAENSMGTIYSNDLTFITFGLVPTVTTLDAKSIGSTIATLNGSVDANFLSTVVTFEYGTTIGYGSNAITTQSPVKDHTVTDVSANIVGLSATTTYHFRVKAVNSLGTSYGNDLSFITSSIAPATVTDIDGNVYNTVTIGSQVWMKENLKTTKYNDGTAIPNITDNTAWASLTSPSYCWYKNDATTYKATYGALYNWFVVQAGGKNACPIGWHVPTIEDMGALTVYLGGDSVAGDKLKEAGTTHWQSPNTGTNESGFTALPSGSRDLIPPYWFSGIKQVGYWWCSTDYRFTSILYMYYSDSSVYSLHLDKQYGFSVRCIRD